ncbi:MAG: ribbon-helix-helix domain-containing protein [Acidobacteriota bacterium]
MAIRKHGVSVSLSREQIDALDEITRRTKISRSTLISESVDTIIRRYAKQLNLPLFPEEKRHNVEFQTK